MKPRQTVPILISLRKLRKAAPGPEPKEQGNQRLAISQRVDDVDGNVEYEPTELLLSLWDKSSCISYISKVILSI